MRFLADRFWLLLGLLLSLTLCSVAYYAGLHGGFVFDDWPNLVLNTRLQVDDPTLESLRQAAFSADSGMLKRPVSMLSFWLNFYTTGLDPFYFKLTNLLIHLVNGLGLFWLSKLLLETSVLRDNATVKQTTGGALALAVAAIWLVHPLNLTGVLYIVQRMTSLSAMFTIAGLLCYVLGRQRLTRGLRGFPLILLGLFGFGSLALLSKENGALLPCLMAVIEVTLFRFSGLHANDSKKLKALFVCTVAVPAVAVVAFVATHPDWLLSQYQTRDFTLPERLMTEARVLWLYLSWTVVPTPAALGLFHDDIPVSHGLLDPPTTLLAIGVGLLVGAAAIRFRRQAPLFAFATFWYLAGHALESSFIGLELIFEHRNYLPIYGPLFAGTYVLMSAANRLSRRARLAVPIAFVLCFGAVTASRSSDWSDFDTLRRALVRHHPDSSRANYEAGLRLGDLVLLNPELAPTYYDEINRYFQRSTSLDDTAVLGLFGVILLNASSDRPIDEPAIERLADRLNEIPLNGTVVGAFRSLVDWMGRGAVTLPQQTVLRLFQAALGNQTATNATRATLLSELSRYHFNIAGDPQNAVSLALAAVEENPAEPAHRLSLAALAVKLGNFDLAARQLDQLGGSDTLGRFTLERRALAEELQLAQARD